MLVGSNPVGPTRPLDEVEGLFCVGARGTCSPERRREKAQPAERAEGPRVRGEHVLDHRSEAEVVRQDPHIGYIFFR